MMHFIGVVSYCQYLFDLLYFIPGTESMSLNDDDDETSDGEDDDTRRGRIGQGHSASNSQSQNTAEDQEDVRTIIVS